MLEEQASAVSQILPERFHETSSSDFIGEISDAAQVAKSPSRSPGSLFIRDSEFTIGFRFHFQVRAQLFIDVVQHGIATEQCTYPVAENLHVASRILATTNARRSHDASSSVSCFSPVLVSV